MLMTSSPLCGVTLYQMVTPSAGNAVRTHLATVVRREWIGECRNWVIEKVEDRTLDRPSQSLGKCLYLLPRLLRKTNLPFRHGFPTPRRAARA